MKIAVTSQNRKTVTEHAGKCRKFWVYEVDSGRVRSRCLRELPLEQSFHESHGSAPHPLDDVNVVITGSIGAGLRQRLKQKGIQALATAETDPDQAVAAFLAGTLPPLPLDANHKPHLGCGHDHSH